MNYEKIVVKKDDNYRDENRDNTTMSNLFETLPFVAPQPVAMPCKNGLIKEFSKLFYI